MKNILQFTLLPLFLTAVFLALPVSRTYSQCQIDAGNDTAVCAFPTFNQVPLNATVVTGSGPFKFTWTYREEYAGRTLTASDFLDDTTSQNPNLINPTGEDEAVFMLSLEDASGNTCVDSVRIRFSKYVVSLDDKKAFIQPGQAVQLYTSVSGGITPLSYRWTPGSYLDDSTQLDAIATPPISLVYLLTITDSVGCEVGDSFEIWVSANSVEDKKGLPHIRMYPNPVRSGELLSVELPEARQRVFVLVDLFGKEVFRANLDQNRNQLDLSRIKPGTYFYRLGTDGGPETSGKLVRQ